MVPPRPHSCCFPSAKSAAAPRRIRIIYPSPPPPHPRWHTLAYTRYINLDCGYSTGFRQQNGSLTVNTTRYPHGMAWLGRQLHSKGLKFGMYSDAGKKRGSGVSVWYYATRPAQTLMRTFACVFVLCWPLLLHARTTGTQQCCSRQYGPKVNDGSAGFESLDAATFAGWGVDYLKHDGCGSKKSSYPDMRDALNKTGRPIYYSIHGPVEVPDIANTWRTTGDITNSWESIVNTALLNSNPGRPQVAHSYAFNDPDMLEVGNLFNEHGAAQGRSHFSMWSVMKAPLLIGTDVTNMTKDTVDTLTNGEVIAVNQDDLGVQASLVRAGNASLTWAGPLSAGGFVVLMVNNGGESTTLHLNASAFDFPAEATFLAEELWSQTKLAEMVTSTSHVAFPTVEPYGCILLRLTRTKPHLHRAQRLARNE